VNEGTAIEFARCKMRELGVDDNYIIRYRHFRLDPNEILEIKGENHLYVFIRPLNNVKVKSKAGIYDMKDDGINELQHVHNGIITVENQTKDRQNCKFIQIIPLLDKNE